MCLCGRAIELMGPRQRLGKNPEDYPDAKSQPHVQVALRTKAKGGTARAGDVIPYVFCLGDNGESAKSAQADRAKHPDEVRRAGSGLQIGACCGVCGFRSRGLM